MHDAGRAFSQKAKYLLWSLLGREGFGGSWPSKGPPVPFQDWPCSSITPTPATPSSSRLGGFPVPVNIVDKVCNTLLRMKALWKCGLISLLKSSTILSFRKESLQVEQTEEKLLWN